MLYYGRQEAEYSVTDNLLGRQIGVREKIIWKSPIDRDRLFWINIQH